MLTRFTGTLMTLLMVLSSTSSIMAFVPSQGRSFVGSSLRVAQPQQDELSWFELPTPRRQKSTLSENLPSVETVVGRIAMIGAVGFMFGELMTGHSVSEQVVEAVAFL